MVLSKSNNNNKISVRDEINFILEQFRKRIAKKLNVDASKVPYSDAIEYSWKHPELVEKYRLKWKEQSVP